MITIIINENANGPDFYIDSPLSLYSIHIESLLFIAGVIVRL